MAIEFPKVQKRTVTENTPGPKYPANTPVEHVTSTGDEPYTTPQPYSPEQQTGKKP